MEIRLFAGSVRCVVVLACLSSAMPAGADFISLGIPGSANAVSADGSVVVGQYNSSEGVRAFRWTAATGLLDLGILSGADLSGATGVSADGSVVVGFGGVPWRWTAATGMVPIAPLPAGFTSGMASDVSADAATIVGTIFSGNGDEFQAFRWIAESGIVPLGTLSGGPQSQALGVSGDGSVVAGYSATFTAQEPFRWTVGAGMIGLGSLPGAPVTFGGANGISADGRVIVGSSVSGLGTQAFRWTDADGMVGLGDLAGGPFSSYALAASADGAVIVGTGSDDLLSRDYGSQSAFIWDPHTGMRSLRDVLIAQGDDLTGWRLAFASGISADGRVIVGTGLNPSGQVAAWLARTTPAEVIPEPTSVTLLGTGALVLLILGRRCRRS